MLGLSVVLGLARQNTTSPVIRCPVVDTVVTHLDLDGRWRALDPAPRVGTIAYESHTVVVERDRLGELIAAGPRELLRRLELFADVAGVPPGLAAGLCQARAVTSAVHEAIEGNAALASQLVWMAESLTR